MAQSEALWSPQHMPQCLIHCSMEGHAHVHCTVWTEELLAPYVVYTAFLSWTQEVFKTLRCNRLCLPYLNSNGPKFSCGVLLPRSVELFSLSMRNPKFSISN